MSESPLQDKGELGGKVTAQKKSDLGMVGGKKEETNFKEFGGLWATSPVSCHRRACSPSPALPAGPP